MTNTAMDRAMGWSLASASITASLPAKVRPVAISASQSSSSSSTRAGASHPRRRRGDRPVEPSDCGTSCGPPSRFVGLNTPRLRNLEFTSGLELNTMSVGIELLAAMVLLEIEKAFDDLGGLLLPRSTRRDEHRSRVGRWPRRGARR